MRRSKLYYINMGMDVLCALICALQHSGLCIVFAGAAFVMSYMGDRAHEMEKTKEDLQ